MKKISVITIILALIYLISGPESLLFSKSNKPVAILMSSSGSVKVLNDKGKYISRGNRLTKIYPDQMILTGARSSCTVLFRDRSTIKLNSGTKILLSKVNMKNSKRKSVGVLKGGVFINVYKKRGESNTFHAFSPTAVAGVRGTQFSINVADDGSTRCSVKEGSVAFGNENDAKIVNQNSYGEANTGEPTKKGRIGNDPETEDKKWVNNKNRQVARNPGGSMQALENEAKTVRNNNTKAYNETRRMRGNVNKDSAPKVARLDYEASKNKARARAIRETSKNMVKKYGRRRGVRSRARRIMRHTSVVERQIKAMDRFISDMAAKVNKLIKKQQGRINDLKNNFMKRGFGGR